MGQKCSLCGRGKATRECPALRQSICSLCCGKGRNRTIECPDDCRFLKQGRERALTKLVVLVGDWVPEEHWYDVLHNLMLALVRLRQSRLRDLTDAEVKEGLANVAATLQAKSKGVIYEFRSRNPRAQFVADGLSLVVGNHEAGEKGFRRVEPGELTRCLRYMKRQVEGALERNVDFLGLAAQAVGRDYFADTLTSSLSLRERVSEGRARAKGFGL